MSTEYLFENGTDTYLFENGTDQLIFDEWQVFSSTLGTATDTGAATAPTGWTSGRALTVTIPEVATEHATVEIAQRNMTGTKGLILFMEGGNNPAWWDDGTGAQSAFMMNLVNDGYRLVQVRGITHYWMDAPLGQRAGAAILAKRATTLFKYVHDTYSGGLPFIVAGSSAGSSALAYALVHHDQDGIIDHAIHCAACPHADLYRGCAQAIGDEKYWTGSPQSANFIDQSSGYAGDNTGPCYIGDASVEGVLWGETSIVGRPASWYQWPTTRVDVLAGSLDAFMVTGLLYRDQLATAGQPHRLGQIPQTTHTGVHDSDKGQQTILAAIRRKPYIGAWAEAAAETGTSLTVTLDVAPVSGERIVALRQWNGAASVGTTPTGWTRVAVATTTGASPRTVAIETKPSDGTEGRVLTFATTGSTVQSLACCVLVNSTGSALSDTSSQTLTGTSMTLSTTPAVGADNVSFGAVAVEETGTNNFNQAWTNDFGQFSDGTSEVFSSSYAIHPSAGTKTTQETWVQSVPAAGITASFSAPTGLTAAVGTAVETDTALAVGHTRARAATPAVETDTALTVGRRKTRAVTAALETDAAQALSRRKTRAAGAALEFDTAISIGDRKTVATVAEADTSLPVTHRKARAVSLAAEADAAQPLGRTKTRLVGTATATSTALSVGRRKTKTISAATETDSTGSVFRPGSFAMVTETDVARPLSPTKRRTAGTATTVDTARPIPARKIRLVSLATEADVATPLGRVKRKAVAYSPESDLALSLFRGKRAGVGFAPEHDTALLIVATLVGFDIPGIDVVATIARRNAGRVRERTVATVPRRPTGRLTTGAAP